MSAIITDQTTATQSSGVSHSAPTTIQVSGVFDGAVVLVEASLDNTDFSVLGRFTRPGFVNAEMKDTYYVRSTVKDVGSVTSVTVASSA